MWMLLVRMRFGFSCACRCFKSRDIVKCKKYLHFIDYVELKKNFINIHNVLAFRFSSYFLRSYFLKYHKYTFHHKFYEIHDKCEE